MTNNLPPLRVGQIWQKRDHLWLIIHESTPIDGDQYEVSGNISDELGAFDDGHFDYITWKQFDETHPTKPNCYSNDDSNNPRGDDLMVLLWEPPC
jgi:hypothetical protein